MTDRDAPRTDISEPFLVLIGPRKKQGGLPFYDVCLVNPKSFTLTNVCTDTGGFYSDDDMGVVNATGKKHELGDIQPSTSVIVEHPDIDELYEFVIWWSITYGNPPETLNFTLFKNTDGVPISPVPIIGGAGILIPRG